MKWKKKRVITWVMIGALLAGSFTMCMNDVGCRAKSKSKRITIEEGQSYKIKVKRGSRIISGNKNVVKVTKKGRIKGIKTGKCTVTVKYGKNKTKYSVVVTGKKSVAAAQPVATPVVTPTAMPTVTPTATPVDIRTIDAYVCDKKDDCLYLSDNKSYMYNAVMSKSDMESDNICYENRKIDWNNIEVGDHICVMLHGAVLYSHPMIYQNILSIVVKDKNPDMINKKYGYEVTGIEGPCYTIKNEYGETARVDYKVVLGFEKCHFYCGDMEVSYEELKVGDTVYLYQSDGMTCNPTIRGSVAKVVIEHSEL